MRSNLAVNRYLAEKCIAICLVLITSFPIFLQAQVAPAPSKVRKSSVEDEKAREQTRWMYKNLSLERDQYEKVNVANLYYAKKLDSLEKLKDKALKNTYKQKVKQERDAAIKGVLTSEQYKQYLLHKDKQTAPHKSPFTGTYTEK